MFFRPVTLSIQDYDHTVSKHLDGLTQMIYWPFRASKVAGLRGCVMGTSYPVQTYHADAKAGHHDRCQPPKRRWPLPHGPHRGEHAAPGVAVVVVPSSAACIVHACSMEKLDMMLLPLSDAICCSVSMASCFRRAPTATERLLNPG